MDELKERIKSVECPFNWGLAEIKDRKPATIVLERLLEKEEEISEPWVHVCINLTVAYLHSENNDLANSITILKECDSILSSSTNNLITKYKPAFYNVYNASRASVLMLSSTASEVKMFLDKVVPVQDLDIPNQAAVHAIKANVFLEFGVSGTTIAVEHAKEALKKNGKEADWHFLMGKLLSRIRHFEQDHNISAAEISHLQTAFNLAGSPRSAIFLANAYIEKSRDLNNASYKNGGRPDYAVRNQTKELTNKAKQLIGIALEKNDNQCIHILIRCAFAYTKLPPYAREMDKAKKLLEESLKRSPCNTMANKLSGDICLQEEKPLYHKALKHYEIAASKNVYSANFAAFEIQVKLSLNPNPEAFYAKMLDKFTEKNYQMLTFIHAMEFYLFIKRDLFTAVNYFMMAIDLDRNFHSLTDRWVKYIMKNVNYYELISNEVRYCIDSQIFHDSNQMNLLKNALKKISEIHPWLMEVPVVPNKVQEYLDTYERESKNASNRGRGRGRGRGAGRGRGRGRGGAQSQSERIIANASGNISSNYVERGGVRPRNRSSSRNRVGQNINDNNQSKFDQSQFNRLSYAKEKSEEVLENPYYVKFLELRYKKMTKSESFKEWLQEYEEAPSHIEKSSNKQNKANKKDKSDTGADAKFQELISVINQLKEEINEIKLSESRSCCSSAHYRRERCHSLRSLEYNPFEKSHKPDKYYSDRNEESENYRRKHRADYLPHDRFKDSRDRYFDSYRSEDRHRWRSEDRNAKYNRISSPFREKDRYSVRRGYNVSPERRSRRRSYYDSDSNSDSESRYSLPHDDRIDRKSRKSSLKEGRKDRNSSRHSSPTYSERRKHRTSSHRYRSEDRRVGSEYMRPLNNSNSESSETDSQSSLSPREDKQRRRRSVDSEHRRHRRNSFSETEKAGKYSKHRLVENQKIGKKSNEEKLNKTSKAVKKEIHSPSSSRSSSDEDRDNRKGIDESSDREPCLGYGIPILTVVKPRRKDDQFQKSYKENYEGSSNESISDEQLVSKKSYPKSKDKVKKDVGYERHVNESSERGHKNKNQVFSEHHIERHSSSGSHKHRNAGSKDKKHDERSEMVSKAETKKYTSQPADVERSSSHKDYRRTESSKMVKKDRDSEMYSHRSPSVKDGAYSHFESSTNQPSSRKCTSVSRSSSDWENITYQESLSARPEINKSERETRDSRLLSDDEYQKTSSG